MKATLGNCPDCGCRAGDLHDPFCLPWPAVFAVAAALTLVLAAVEVRRPSYHGIGRRRLNRGLPEWWAARIGGLG